MELKKTLYVLFVEDSEDDVVMTLHVFRKNDWELMYERVETPRSLEIALIKRKWDVIISDYHMPQFSALTAFKMLQLLGLDIPFLISSSTLGDDLSSIADSLGIKYYLSKYESDMLVPLVE